MSEKAPGPNLSESVLCAEALVFPMQRITSAFVVAFLAAHVFAALGACGPSAITGWFVVQQLVLIGVVVSVPVVMRSVVREHVKASCDSQDSDSLACPGRNIMLSKYS